ncbi:hypothetical protein E2C01_050471 [Portunus trituberculatus]|uniref:Uncharacterized protein n=1 Tax=Portunus trituberculatus TaxID=210409 RepID=A0A5B7GHF6_PORTR|nr:hypothetical protein [Portunus trituberculatus]
MVLMEPVDTMMKANIICFFVHAMLNHLFLETEEECGEEEEELGGWKEGGAVCFVVGGRVGGVDVEGVEGVEDVEDEGGPITFRRCLSLSISISSSFLTYGHG